MLTLKEYSKEKNISLRRVYEMVEDGRLKTVEKPMDVKITKKVQYVVED